MLLTAYIYIIEIYMCVYMYIFKSSNLITLLTHCGIVPFFHNAGRGLETLKTVTMQYLIMP
jgi:hypothetical protein